ncbi:hypothetical protein E1091_07480 [Micromonospora fluostatini]|uniref:DUF4097 domain-containing protein n=1 Tax=Micromonospora fluostatini TaxID=1629071 RepID=A0ABY2DN52_9ACTN|nr:hypothetical protein E1091_07480 [Micromonospora fluostatini]
MATIKRHRVRVCGPVALDVESASGGLLVRAQDGVQAEIVVKTDDDSGPSAEAVKGARFIESGQNIRVELPQVKGGMSGVNIVIGSGVTMVNGRVVSGGYSSVGHSPIYIAALVPTNSSLRAKTTSGGVETQGELAHVNAHTMSGGIRIDSAASAQLQSMSGSVRLRDLRGDAQLKSMSGGIDVRASQPCRVDASTMSGDIEVSGDVDLQASSMTGRVHHERPRGSDYSSQRSEARAVGWR